MTQHPGQNDPTEGEDPTTGRAPEETGGDTDSAAHQPTKPLGSTPSDPRTTGQAPEQGRPVQPGQGPGQPGTGPAHPGQPGQRPYGQSATPPQQGPGGGFGTSGYGYGQQQGYPAQGQPGQVQPGQAPSGPGGQQYGGQYSGQSYQQPYPQQYAQNQGTPTTNRSPEGKNFFAALFDFSFQSFVAVKFAKFIYAILIAFLVLGYLFIVVVSFTDSAAAGVTALLLGWIPAAIYLILIRISLEFMIALVRTSQNTAGTRSEIEALRSELKNRR